MATTLRFRRSDGLRLAAVLSAVGCSRRYVHHVLTQWDIHEDHIENAALLTSEMVTNSIQATGIVEPHPAYGAVYEGVKLIGIRLLEFDCSLVIEVWIPHWSRQYSIRRTRTQSTAAACSWSTRSASVGVITTRVSAARSSGANSPRWRRGGRRLGPRSGDPQTGPRSLAGTDVGRAAVNRTAALVQRQRGQSPQDVRNDQKAGRDVGNGSDSSWRTKRRPPGRTRTTEPSLAGPPRPGRSADGRPAEQARRYLLIVLQRVEELQGLALVP